MLLLTDPYGPRERQLSFYDQQCGAEFEISRPHGCGRLYEFLVEHKFRTGLLMLRFEVAGRSVLELCCGSGMITEKFALAGAAVTGIDFSAASVARARERCRRRGFTAQFLIADAENLAFADRSFDIVAVHDGLHHLEYPDRAIREMARIARHEVLILEPARATLTRLAVHLGIAVDVEEAGNAVQRLVPRKIARILRDLGYSEIRWKRTLMYYPHRPSAWFRWFDHSLLFALFRLLFAVVDLGLGRWGNKLALGAMR
jgi:SAM-dependent methyltransferase